MLLPYTKASHLSVLEKAVTSQSCNPELSTLHSPRQARTKHASEESIVVSPHCRCVRTGLHVDACRRVSECVQVHVNMEGCARVSGGDWGNVNAWRMQTYMGVGMSV